MTSEENIPEESNIPAPDVQVFHAMFDENKEVMLLIDPVSGEIVDANQAAMEFYGYAKVKLCSMSINEINTMSPEQITMERQRALHEERNYFIFPHRLSNGEERIVEVYSSPIFLYGKQLLFSTIHDITDHKPLEKVMWVRPQ